VHTALPGYVFQLVEDAETHTILRVEVFRIGQSGPPDVLDLKDSESDSVENRQDVLEFQDLNFDGYLDIGVLEWWGATGNRGYRYWLLEPASGRFINAQIGVVLCNPIADPTTQQITTWHNDGGPSYTRETLMWTAEGLAMIQREWQESADTNHSAPRRMLRCRQERSEDGWRVVTAELVTEDEEAPPTPVAKERCG
jgi:hypothetical protein